MNRLKWASEIDRNLPSGISNLGLVGGRLLFDKTKNAARAPLLELLHVLVGRAL